MADIELTRSHSMGLDEGRTVVEEVAQQLEVDLGVQYEWDDEETLLFEGQGAEGQIDVRAQDIRLLINLSAFLKPMKGTLKAEAAKYLDRHLEA
jgi:putative polyhydroxyalkanoate system protein